MENESNLKKEFLDVPTSVWVVYANILLLVAASMAGSPVYVIYFNNLGWTTKSDVLFYGIVNFLTPFCTVLFNPLFGFWQGRRPTKELFLFDIVFSAYGYLIMALVDSNRWIWLVGFILSRISTSMGSCRTTYIIRTTSEARRTRALAFQPVAALLGAFLGPLVAILCAFAPDIEEQGILFNAQTITFWVCLLLTLLRLPLLLFAFSEAPFSDTADPAADRTEQRRTDARSFRWLLFFGACLFLTQLSIGTYSLTFYPILTDDFHFRQSAVSVIMIIVILCSILPPLFIALLGHRLGISDRTFLLTGLLGGILPSALFAYPTGALWNIVTGGCLAIVFTQMIGPIVNTLFSKKVGTHNASGFKVGLLIAASSLGNALGSILGDLAIKGYGQWQFILWIIPLMAATLLVIVCWSHLYLEKKDTQAITPSESINHEDMPLLMSSPSQHEPIESNQSISFIIHSDNDE